MIHSANPHIRPAVILAWFWSFGTDGRTDNLCENCDHYRSASWIKNRREKYRASSVVFFSLSISAWWENEKKEFLAIGLSSTQTRVRSKTEKKILRKEEEEEDAIIFFVLSYQQQQSHPLCDRNKVGKIFFECRFKEIQFRIVFTKYILFLNYNLSTVVYMCDDQELLCNSS